MDETAKAEKPRGKCTGCAFEYQLGTARTGDHKGKLVIRKHNSRTGPGLCSGASAPPYDEQDCACGGAGADDGCPNCSTREHCVPGRCEGCCGCSSMCTTDPCGQPGAHPDAYPQPVAGDVVGVAPGGTPIVVTPLDADGKPVGEPFDAVGAITLCPSPVDPFTAPLAIAGGDVSDSPVLGPWGTATFDSDCDGVSCGVSILEGMDIRADGEGGWLCESCGEDAEIVLTTVPNVVYSDTPHEVVQDPDSTNGTFVLPMSWDTAPAPQSGAALRFDAIRHAPHPQSMTNGIDAEPTPENVMETVVQGLRESRYIPSANPVPDPWSAPAPASLIPESTTTVSGQPEPDRDSYGRYKIHGQAHTRATTFAKLGANTKAIEAWNERNVVRGLTLRPDLLMLANGLEVKKDRQSLNSIAAQAKDAAGSKVAANIGTAYHAFSERVDAGLITPDQVPNQYGRRVRQYVKAVAEAGLTTRPEWIERTTAVRADQVGAPLPVAGTLDRIFQLPDGSLVIGDLKTGSDLRYGEMEIEVQLALYAHGVNTHGLFDWNTKTWQRYAGVSSALGADFLKVRTDIAIVIHLPADGDGCTLYVADIERGWRDAQRLGPLQASLREKKRFRTLTAADLAPRPTAVEHGEVAQYLATQPAPSDSKWELAKGLISSAPSQAAIAQLYQFALDSGEFHVDQLAVLVDLGKDRLNALARV